MFDKFRAAVKNHLWDPPENKLTFVLGVATFAALFYLHYPLLMASAITLSAMFVTLSVAKSLKFIYNLASDFHQLLKKTSEIMDGLKDKLDKTDKTLNDDFSPAAIDLMEQATRTLAALEAAMPEVGEGFNKLKAFNGSRVGSLVSTVFGSSKKAAATLDAAPSTEATVTSERKEKKAKAKAKG